MQSLSPYNYLVIVMAGILVWVSLRILIGVVRLNRTYELIPNRFVYPAKRKPQDCQDVAGFIGFITPRLVIFSVLGLLLSALMLVSQLPGLKAGLPSWFSDGAWRFLLVFLFFWYIIFINKAARQYW